MLVFLLLLVFPERVIGEEEVHLLLVTHDEAGAVGLGVFLGEEGVVVLVLSEVDLLVDFGGDDPVQVLVRTLFDLLQLRQLFLLLLLLLLLQVQFLLALLLVVFDLAGEFVLFLDLLFQGQHEEPVHETPDVF